jgi:hypothetical protein
MLKTRYHYSGRRGDLAELFPFFSAGAEIVSVLPPPKGL